MVWSSTLRIIVGGDGGVAVVRALAINAKSRRVFATRLALPPDRTFENPLTSILNVFASFARVSRPLVVKKNSRCIGECIGMHRSACTRRRGYVRAAMCFALSREIRAYQVRTIHNRCDRGRRGGVFAKHFFFLFLHGLLARGNDFDTVCEIDRHASRNCRLRSRVIRLKLRY